MQQPMKLPVSRLSPLGFGLAVHMPCHPSELSDFAVVRVIARLGMTTRGPIPGLP